VNRASRSHALPALRLAWKHLRHHRAQSIILVVCIALSLFLPVAVRLLTFYYDQVLTERADATPLVIGAAGNRFDLVLKSIYFSSPYDRNIRKSDEEALRKKDFGRIIPLHLRHQAQAMQASEDAPTALIGTSPAYYAFRNLKPASGRLPTLLGEAVLGSAAAVRFGGGVGDSILSTPKAIYDLEKSFQLKLQVVGILQEGQLADNRSVFTTVKTAWVMDGYYHGHEGGSDADAHVRSTGKAVYQEITDANRDQFHAHAGTDQLPLTAMILVPHGDSADARNVNLILATTHVNVDLADTHQAIAPSEVISELMHRIFAIRKFFDAHAILVGLATCLFLFLVFSLSFRIRKREFETLYKMGISKKTIRALLGWEVSLILIAAIVLASGCLGVLMLFQPFFLRWIGV